MLTAYSSDPSAAERGRKMEPPSVTNITLSL